MTLSPQEKAARRAAFREMSAAKKREHIWEYYKWPILLGLLALLVLGSIVREQLSRREPMLYLAFANVSVGEELESALTDGFLESVGADLRRREVSLYADLYLSEDADQLNHQYAYASRIKLMGALASRKLDLVLMNREGYDFLSRQGYLQELAPALFQSEPALYEALLPTLTENEVVLSDNSVEYQLGNAASLEIVTERVSNGLNVSALPLFRAAGFDGEVYLGLLANSPRPDAVLGYLNYLFS